MDVNVLVELRDVVTAQLRHELVAAEHAELLVEVMPPLLAGQIPAPV